MKSRLDKNYVIVYNTVYLVELVTRILPPSLPSLILGYRVQLTYPTPW